MQHYLATVYYRTQAGGNTWMGDVQASNTDEGFTLARAAFAKARPQAKHCRIDQVDLVPATQQG